MSHVGFRSEKQDVVRDSNEVWSPTPAGLGSTGGRLDHGLVDSVVREVSASILGGIFDGSRIRCSTTDRATGSASGRRDPNAPPRVADADQRVLDHSLFVGSVGRGDSRHAYLPVMSSQLRRR